MADPDATALLRSLFASSDADRSKMLYNITGGQRSQPEQSAYARQTPFNMPTSTLDSIARDLAGRQLFLIQYNMMLQNGRVATRGMLPLQEMPEGGLESVRVMDMYAANMESLPPLGVPHTMEEGYSEYIQGSQTFGLGIQIEGGLMDTPTGAVILAGGARRLYDAAERKMIQLIMAEVLSSDRHPLMKSVQFARGKHPMQIMLGVDTFPEMMKKVFADWNMLHRAEPGRFLELAQQLRFQLLARGVVANLMMIPQGTLADLRLQSDALTFDSFTEGVAFFREAGMERTASGMVVVEGQMLPLNGAARFTDCVVTERTVGMYHPMRHSDNCRNVGTLAAYDPLRRSIQIEDWLEEDLRVKYLKETQMNTRMYDENKAMTLQGVRVFGGQNVTIGRYLETQGEQGEQFQRYYAEVNAAGAAGRGKGSALWTKWNALRAQQPAAPAAAAAAPAAAAAAAAPAAAAGAAVPQDLVGLRIDVKVAGSPQLDPLYPGLAAFAAANPQSGEARIMARGIAAVNQPPENWKVLMNVVYGAAEADVVLYADALEQKGSPLALAIANQTPQQVLGALSAINVAARKPAIVAVNDLVATARAWYAANNAPARPGARRRGAAAAAAAAGGAAPGAGVVAGTEFATDAKFTGGIFDLRVDAACDFWLDAIDAKVPTPIDYAVARLVTNKLGSALAMRGGSETGKAYVGYVHMEQGNDVRTRSTFIRYSADMMAFIVRPANIAHARNISDHGYVRGGATGFWNPHDGKARAARKMRTATEMGGLLVYPMSLTQKLGPMFDLTGTHCEDVQMFMPSLEAADRLYPNLAAAPYVADVWGIQPGPAFDINFPHLDGLPAQLPTSCVWRGPTHLPEFDAQGDVKYTKVIYGEGHWGPITFPGISINRLGKRGGVPVHGLAQPVNAIAINPMMRMGQAPI